MNPDDKRTLELLGQTPPWEWDVERAGGVILAGLTDEDEAARLEAAQFASAVMNDEVARALLELCRSDPNGEVAGAAAIALGPCLEEGFTEFGDDEQPDPSADPDMVAVSFEVYQVVRQVLQEVFQDEGRPKLVRRRAMEAAVRSPGAWHRGAVRDLIGLDDPEWRLTGMFCTAFMTGFEAEILQGLTAPELPVRQAAVMAAGEQGVAAAGPAVLTLARAPGDNPELRLIALAALATLDPPGAEELLFSLAEGDDEDLAELAEEVLEERVIMGQLDGVV